MGLLDAFKEQQGGLAAIFQRFGDGVAAGDHPFSRGFAGSWNADKNRKQAALQEEMQRQQLELLKARTADEAAQSAARNKPQKPNPIQGLLQQIQGGEVEEHGPTPDGNALTRTVPARMPTLLEATQIKAGGGPDLLPLLQYGQRGVERDGGKFYTDPSTGQTMHMPRVAEGQSVRQDGTVFNMPGYSQGVATTEGMRAGAVARAQFPVQKALKEVDASLTGEDIFDPETQTPRRVSRLEAFGRPMSAPQGAPAQVGGAGQTSRPRHSFASTDAEKDRLAILNSELARAQTRFQNASSQQERDRAAGDINALNGEIGRAGGVARGVQTGPSQTQKLDAKASEQLNEDFIKGTLKQVTESGATASGMLSTISTARRGLSGIGGSGFGTDAKVEAARVLGALGVNKADQYASNAELFRNAATTRVNEILLQHKGVQTEGDAQRARDQFAQLKNTTRANEYILDLAEATAKREQARARFYQQALPIARQRGDLTELDREWQKRALSVFDDPIMKRWQQ